MLDEELNETAVKAKAIAEIVEIALNNLMTVSYTHLTLPTSPHV